MAHIGEAVAVLVDQEGAPTLFRWGEMTYLVVTRPVRYFARSDWWIGENASKGMGSFFEVEVWIVFVDSEGSKSKFQLARQKSTKCWFLLYG